MGIAYDESKYLNALKERGSPLLTAKYRIAKDVQMIY
tara:strand:+ start:1500 stop:1610 length:111 start_codon:yes stop_codon:yes gene_type:complete